MEKHLHIISRAKAKEFGMTRYFTGTPCKHGHISERYCNSANWCCECTRIANHKSREAYGGMSSPAAKRWRQENRERHLENNRRWNRENSDRILSIEAERRKTDIGYKVKKQCQNMIHRTLRKTASKKTSRTEEMLGYTKDDLIRHLESKFSDGMTWDNFGRGPGFWNIDHIKPISVMIAEGEKDPSVIDALSNLQPLWFEDNAKKSNNF